MLIAILSVVLLALQAPATVTVRDTTGAVIAGADVVVSADNGEVRRAASGPDGRLTLELPEGILTITVRAAGFVEQTQTVMMGHAPLSVDLVLEPEGPRETITVTPTRSEQPIGDVPASVHVLDNAAIRQSPALVADDLLRQVPTFSLFRRTSSLSSHPTAQGVSLRGIGPSGVSRTLVLLDGVPFNDPFGGWVYWTRAPLEAADRLEVVDGTSSSLYGNYAMGGVINILTRPAVRRVGEVAARYGNRETAKVDFLGGAARGKTGAFINGSWFQTGGFPVVIENERGPIDTNATVEYTNVSGKVDFAPGTNAHSFLRAGYFREDRSNAKILEVNDTRWSSVSGGTRLVLPGGSRLELTGSGDFETFHSTFVAVTAPSTTVPPRSIVRLTTDQRVPVNAGSAAVLWAIDIGRVHALSAGFDWRAVKGDSEEDAYNAAPGPVTPPVQNSVLAVHRVSGGTQRSAGVFVQDVMKMSRWTLTLSARGDWWKNFDAHNLETNIPSGTPTANSRLLASTSASVVSPRATALFHATDRINLWGSVGAGFRAPTLNELYRQFRVGTVLTLANERLGPERLTGGEAGVTVHAGNATVRATGYDNRIKDPVSNVTISSSGASVTQQRQNLGRTRVRGLQTDLDVRLGSNWRASGGYLFNAGKVAEFAANPALVGNALPQVPRHRGSMRLTFQNSRTSAAFGVQVIGRQFDDDLNARTVPGETVPGLPAYAVADAMVSHTLMKHVGVFFGVQNLFNQTYIVGTLPTTIGSPRLFDAGIRIGGNP